MRKIFAEIDNSEQKDEDAFSDIGRIDSQDNPDQAAAPLRPNATTSLSLQDILVKE